MKLFSVIHIVVGIVLALNCSGPGASLEHSEMPRKVPEVVISRGGELKDERPEFSGLKVKQNDIVVWGMVEVPADSRMQAAIASVEAITRAELLKAIQVSVASLAIDVSSSQEGQTQIINSCAEAVSGTLAQAGPMPYGWAQIAREGEKILRLWAKLSLPKHVLQQALGQALNSTSRVNPSAIIDKLAGPSPPVASEASGPAWTKIGDKTTDQGHHFVCQGEGKTEDDAKMAAEAICNDKICKVCGVEIESVVQTTETLKGIDMQRKVVERCRRVRQAEPVIQYKSSECGPQGCSMWLMILFSKEAEKAECPAYASEKFADPAECQRLIDTFRNLPGRDAASFRARLKLLDDALISCKDIDVRPTPLIESLHQKLFAGMDMFEFTPQKQQNTLETPFFDTTWYKSREDMMDRRSTNDWYLTTFEPLRQQIRESPSLEARIHLVHDYVTNKALVFDVIEACLAKDLNTAPGMHHLETAMRTAPLGGQYGAPDVHFVCMYKLEDVREDTHAIQKFYRDSYDPTSLYWNHGIPFAHIFSADGLVDTDEWNYLFSLHKAHSCVVCLTTALSTKNHGSPKVRDERFFATLNFELAQAKRPSDRLRALTRALPNDPEFLLHIRPQLPKDLQAGLNWDFFKKQLDDADDLGDPIIYQQILSLLSATLTMIEANSVDETYCNQLPEQLKFLENKQASPINIDAQICACLTGPLKNEGTRSSSTKSDLYDRALSRWLPCVKPRN